MQNATKFIGLDVSKDKIAIAIADQGREEARFWGTIPHTKEAVHTFMKRMSKEECPLEVCYEAGPTGYKLYHWLLEMDVSCTVIAPSLIPKRPGDRVKTDRRDAIRLAQLFRAGELVAIHVPTEEDEAFRDLVRAREDAKEDGNRQGQRLGKLLLRLQMMPPSGASEPGSARHEGWLDTLRFERDSQRVTFEEYRHSIRETRERIKRYEREIEKQAETGQFPLVTAFQALRGIALVSAATLAAEIGDIQRFAHPRQLMSYAGVVPSERSSGDGRWQGKITKAGNAHLRRIIIEASWSYQHVPGVRRVLRKRLEGMSPEIQAISWTAQTRLHKKMKRMRHQGKNGGIIAVAIARELLGFVWAIGQEVNKQGNKAS